METVVHLPARLSIGTDHALTRPGPGIAEPGRLSDSGRIRRNGRARLWPTNPMAH